MNNANNIYMGRLFYLMGASGTGKDSLLNYLREHLPPHARVELPRRYITRPANSGGEEHCEITPRQFQRRQTAGDFAMHWRSHGLHYGIDREIDDWLAGGAQVVLNGSRHYLETARQRYPSLQPVLLRVSHPILLQRLILRGREGAQEIEQRLRRAEALDRELVHHELMVLNNDGPLQEAGEALLDLVMRHVRTDRQPPFTMSASK